MGAYSVEVEPVKSWDEYFYNIAIQTARNSKCLSRRIGAVLVRDKSIISSGYNGPPRGVPPCNQRWELDDKFNWKYKTKIINSNYKNMCPRVAMGARSGKMLEICIAGHAEENAILNAARMGVCTKDASLYLSCAIPCFRCMIKIINAGITEVVVTALETYDDNTEFLLKHSDVNIRLYDFVKE